MILKFQKSSYSAQNQNCVEVAHIPADFQKSSYSGAGQNCVEVAGLSGGVAVRDSEHPDTGHFPFPASEWASFLSAALSE
ncbi:DUF397 domain-containing protein [Nocardiopsis alba]|uniref:DUF397 domain-containing protein n=1 Tax=Nocardiopsis alba TaxID=53437 RepID=UPI0037F685CF